jgi:hypothetical protein
MIVYDLTCPEEHVFEAWFPSSAAFEEQSAAGGLACPLCGSNEIAKALMAPSLSAKVGEERRAAPKEQAKAVRRALNKLREAVEQNCDYVGPAFPEEVRKIYYGESEERNIYGEASRQEAESLAEEGIEVQQIPWLPPEN